METGPVRVDVAWGRSDDRDLLLRLVAAGLDAEPADLLESRICRVCGGSDHGRPSVRLRGAGAGWVSVARHAQVSVAAWSPDAPVGVDVDSSTAGEAWVRREARGKTDGSGITGTDPAHVATRILSAPAGLVAALAVDASEPWSVTVT